MVMRPENIGANKNAKISVGRSTTVHSLSFCVSYTVQELRNQNVSIAWLVPQSVAKNYCVLCMVKGKKANKIKQQRTLSRFINSPLH